MNMDEPITAPEDWRELAKLPVEELGRQLQHLRQPRDDESAEAEWIRVMRVIPRVRALMEHYRGKEFEEQALLLTGYGKTTCHKIVASGIADRLTEIWERVHVDAHAANVRGVVYHYPGVIRMMNWYRLPTDDETERRILREIEPYWRRDQQVRDNRK